MAVVSILLTQGSIYNYMYISHTPTGMLSQYIALPGHVSDTQHIKHRAMMKLGGVFVSSTFVLSAGSCRAFSSSHRLDNDC